MPAEVGSNSDVTLKRFAERIAGLLDQIKDIQAEVKTEMDSAKAAGFSTKALNKVVKEMGLDEEKRQAQLEFEWEVDTYRRIVGLPTEIATEKQEAA